MIIYLVKVGVTRDVKDSFFATSAATQHIYGRVTSKIECAQLYHTQKGAKSKVNKLKKGGYSNFEILKFVLDIKDAEVVEKI